jgi:peptide chain release factor 1
MNTQKLRERLLIEIERFKEIEHHLSASEKSPELLKEYGKKHSQLAPRVERISEFLILSKQLDDSKSLIDDPSGDPEVRKLALEDVRRIEEELRPLRESIEALLLPPDPNDGKNVIIEIRAGTGGEEAALFAADLMRMYLRYTEKRGLKSEILSMNDTGLGGIKEVIFSVEGAEAYERLHLEAGTHRVQRIPETESGGRIHTSAVTVAVLADAEEEEVEIDERDLKIDVYRASGAGGQHVNKTESAVRILHIPSGLVVSCQDERSQIKNRARAMRVLRARLLEKAEHEKHEKDARLKRDQIKSGDRSERIRTYNFPQGRVTDHRIGLTLYNLAVFMNGELDEMLNALVGNEREMKLRALNEEPIS